MKYIKLAAISFVFLFLFITVMSLFMPSHVQISKIVNIHTQPDSLWKVVGDFKTWEKWNSILPELSDENPEYSDDFLKTKKIAVSWKQKDSGLYLASISRNNGNPILTGWKWSNDLHSDSLSVQWYIDIHLRWYPWEKFAGMLYEKSYGDKLSQGLVQLKKNLENRLSN